MTEPAARDARVELPVRVALPGTPNHAARTVRTDGASASTDSASARSCATSDPTQHRRQQEAGGRDAGDDERAPRAVGSARGAAPNPTVRVTRDASDGQSRLLKPSSCRHRFHETARPRATTSRRPRPGRLRLVQHFVNTTDHEHSRELLRDARRDCAGWLRRERCRGRAAGPAALRRAHDLRDALRELVVTGIAGQALDEAARPRKADGRPRGGRHSVLGRRSRRRARHDRRRGLRRDPRRQLGALQGVPELRLGVLGRVAQPLGGVVLDAALRQPPQGEAAPRRRSVLGLLA